MSLSRSPILAAGLGALSLLGLAAPAAHAAVVFANGNFSNRLAPGYYYAYSDAAYPVPRMPSPFSVFPWSFSGGSGVINGQSTAFGPTKPVQGGVNPASFAFIQSGSTPGSVTQMIGLTAGTYNLSFDYAGRSPSMGNASFDVTLDALIGGKNVLSTLQPITTTTGQAFTPYSYTFTIGSFPVLPNVPRVYTLDFFNTSTTGDNTAFISDVNISPAPEPSQVGMLALMGLGLSGLILRARKAKAVAA